MSLAASAAENPLQAWIRALDRTAPFARGDGRPLPALITEAAATHGPRPALLADDATLSYAALAAKINRYAR